MTKPLKSSPKNNDSADKAPSSKKGLDSGMFVSEKDEVKNAERKMNKTTKKSS